ncbi:MAG: N-acetylglucosamine-6-phosphate deacetylase [Clostridia bacterium]|nr:N-acetylglucosamine-6-phosphate deacetylase [Clostridia bacterium]
MSLIRIKNGLVITDTVEKTNVYIENGKIFAVTEEELPADEVIDAEGLYVSPGFIDTHVHGGGGHDFMDGGTECVKGALAAHLAHGSTTVVPTTLSESKEAIMQAIADVKQAISENDDLPYVPGVHLEGPYFSPAQAGAQDPRYITPPIPEDYQEIVESADGFIVKYAFAPELPGTVEFCDYLTEHGILPAAGHTDCTYDDLLVAHEHGTNIVTHLYSGMSTITRKEGFRVLGAVEGTYLLDDMYAEVIADGLHLPPELLKLIYKIKGADRICLITDAMRGADMPEGKSILGSLKNGTECIIEGGIAKMPDRKAFAGSVATTDRLVRVCVHQAGIPLTDAVKMASTTPAVAHGLKHKGAIRPGYDADILLFDENIQIKKVIIKKNEKVKIYGGK